MVLITNSILKISNLYFEEKDLIWTTSQEDIVENYFIERKLSTEKEFQILEVVHPTYHVKNQYGAISQSHHLFQSCYHSCRLTFVFGFVVNPILTKLSFSF